LENAKVVRHKSSKVLRTKQLSLTTDRADNN
jgi:hypothetical protein